MGQELYEGHVYCSKEKLVSGTDLRPNQTPLLPSPTFSCRDPQPAAQASITGGLDRTGPPWLPTLRGSDGPCGVTVVERRGRRRDQETRGGVLRPTRRQGAEQSDEHPRQRQAEAEQWHRQRKSLQYEAEREGHSSRWKEDSLPLTCREFFPHPICWVKHFQKALQDYTDFKLFREHSIYHPMNVITKAFTLSLTYSQPSQCFSNCNTLTTTSYEKQLCREAGSTSGLPGQRFTRTSLNSEALTSPLLPSRASCGSGLL